jgi:hypothetical protein
VAQKSFLAIGGNNVVVALMSVGQTSVALTSVAKTSVGEKSRHHSKGKTSFKISEDNIWLFKIPVSKD